MNYLENGEKMLLCSACQKYESEFSPSQFARGNRRRCRNCVRLDRAKYTKKNPEIVRSIRQQFHEKNKEEQNAASRKWARENKFRRNAQLKEKRSNDPIFRLRDVVSCSIRNALKSNGGSKNGYSFEDYLPYTIQELKKHIQSLFEPWMTWENQGAYYIDTWDDNDISTWTWQIDHIIPHSSFNYTSMQNKEFQKCWALENLRPLSAKKNLLKSNKMETV